MRFFFKICFVIAVNAVAFWVLDTKLFTGELIVSGGLHAYLYIASVFGILNIFLRPLVSLITLPLRILSLGFFGLIINAFLLWALQYSVNLLDLFNTSLHIQGFQTYVISGIFLSFLNWLLHIIHE
ncbi:phage holin family protein [Candidatus Gracilibacteria bacterium]|nr:phage holin family protein [Candidatus Gracilibacteria bacterium]